MREKHSHILIYNAAKAATGVSAMNIQIFGRTKCFDTKKAVRYFKERNIKVQLIDLLEKPMSKGEFTAVSQAIGKVELLVDQDSKHKEMLTLVKYLAKEEQMDKIFENQQLLKTPIVRNGKHVTVGYAADIWKTWE